MFLSISLPSSTSFVATPFSWQTDASYFLFGHPLRLPLPLRVAIDSLRFPRSSEQWRRRDAVNLHIRSMPDSKGLAHKD